ncbi:IS91 family transposase [Puniceibacterium sp. IMCC21224]|uniref:IS91 family transposase n=1 Tax=Puniceibacterium sp. IMCC21224 TaxID=1618204 RepID=UPI00064E0092|nr:IS91 family transposase [Puniceibacterium sp. IMCC21224]KMK65267.1 Transposase zinc-binding domain/putative transposase [Puniceibacterium sp. IMCC21224]
MPRPKLEIADIFRAHGPAWRQANAGRVSLSQLKVMSAIEACRTEALGGHVAGCAKCGHHHIAYNSCKNRHCPKCQGPAARDWMEARAEDLLPVEYFHVVFTIPAEIAQIAYWNKKAVYGLLFKASAQTVMTIAADPKRLGARIGMTSVLHTWGSALTHHPHIHMIVPGGGLSPDSAKWVACKPGFFLHVRVLSRLFRRLFLDGLMELHRTGQLAFFGDLEGLAAADAFKAWLAPFRKAEWVVYAKPPFGGPEAVLAYLSRYTHRVAISNARLVSADAQTVAFSWKDYRIKSGAPLPGSGLRSTTTRGRQKVMRLATPEFIRRFLIHVLPEGFHRIRHYGLLASSTRKDNITKIRALLCLQGQEQATVSGREAEITPLTLREPCPCCGGPMRIIEIFRRGQKPMSRAPPRQQAA